MHRPNRSWRQWLFPPLPEVALRAWVILAVATAVKVCVSPHEHTAYLNFWTGCWHWWTGGDIYADELTFRYSPTFAVLLTPFALFPFVLGNILWNSFSLAALYVGVQRLARHVLPGAWSPRREALLLLAVLPSVIRPIWSSQSHVLCAAALFLGVAAIAERRWWRAGWLLALPVYLKLAPLTLALVLVALWPRRLGPRFAVGLLGLGALPLVSQIPSYSVWMYSQWFAHLAETSAKRWPSFRDAWQLWELSGLPFHLGVYRALQAAAGLALLAWCLWMQRRACPMRSLLTYTLGLGVVYLLLFGPAVEFVQYVLLGPVLGWAMLEAWHRQRDRLWVSACFVMTMVLGFGAVERGLERLTGVPQVTGVLALGTLLFGLWLIRDAHTALRRTAANEVQASVHDRAVAVSQM